MTGMPGFNLVEATDEEIWTIAAFVKKLPTDSEADYKAWTSDTRRIQKTPVQIWTFDEGLWSVTTAAVSSNSIPLGYRLHSNYVLARLDAAWQYGRAITL
jgi:hypothetical protein